jgi:hypothetical protein
MVDRALGTGGCARIARESFFYAWITQGSGLTVFPASSLGSRAHFASGKGERSMHAANRFSV